MLEKHQIFTEIDEREETLSYKMRDSQTRKIPYTLIIGEKEKENHTISYRIHGSKETKTISKEEFLSYLLKKIEEKETDF